MFIPFLPPFPLPLFFPFPLSSLLFSFPFSLFLPLFLFPFPFSLFFPFLFSLPFPLFPFLSPFFLFPIFALLPDFWCPGGSLPPLPPHWLRPCVNNKDGNRYETPCCHAVKQVNYAAIFFSQIENHC